MSSTAWRSTCATRRPQQGSPSMCASSDRCARCETLSHGIVTPRGLCASLCSYSRWRCSPPSTIAALRTKSRVSVTSAASDAHFPPYHLLISGFRSADDWCTAFSLDKNLRWLFSTNSSPGDIEAVHGIRFLNAVMLIFSHKSMAMFFNPYNNRTTMAESLGQPWTVIGRAASLYTDPFLLFSGMLTSYSLFGRLMKQQPIRLKNEYISRLMR